MQSYTEEVRLLRKKGRKREREGERYSDRAQKVFVGYAFVFN